MYTCFRITRTHVSDCTVKRGGNPSQIVVTVIQLSVLMKIKEGEMNKLTPVEQLSALTDQIVDMILNMSDDEILAESEKQGISLSTSANIYDSIADSAKIEAKRIEFKRLRTNILDKPAKSKPKGKLPSHFNGKLARSILNHVANDTKLKLTWTAHNIAIDELSDSEAIQYVTDLVDELDYKIPRKFFQ